MIETLKPFKDPKYIPVEEALRQLREYRRDIDGYNPETPAVDTQAQGAFLIEDLGNRYRLSNVPYNGGMWAFDWYKDLLSDGENLPQNEWIKRTQSNSIKLPNSKMIHANLAALCTLKFHATASQRTLLDDVLEKIFRPDFMTNYPNTSTRIAYQPQGKDYVIHNIGYADQHITEEDITGPESSVNRLGMEKPLLAILGTDDLFRVETVYSILFGKQTFLWRLNNKPQEEELRAVLFDLNSMFNISLDSDYNNARPARGVVAQRMEELQK
jgi:hypothetical protein